MSGVASGLFYNSEARTGLQHRLQNHQVRRKMQQPHWMRHKHYRTVICKLLKLTLSHIVDVYY